MSTDLWEALPSLENTDHAYLTEHLASALRQAISAGALLPGAKLPEVQLTEHLGVSRHTLRSAFVALAGEGLLDRRPNRGVFVHSPGTEDVCEIYRIRRVVETGAVSTADFDSSSLKALQEIVERARSARAQDDAMGMADANQQFHRQLVAQAQSPTLDEFMGQVLARMRLVFLTQRCQPDFHSGYVDQNAQLIDLLAQGQHQQAAGFLTEYLSTAEADLMHHLSSRPDRQA